MKTKHIFGIAKLRLISLLNRNLGNNRSCQISKMLSIDSELDVTEEEFTEELFFPTEF